MQTTAWGGVLVGEGSQDVARPWAGPVGVCLGSSDPSLGPSMSCLTLAHPSAQCPSPTDLRWLASPGPTSPCVSKIVQPQHLQDSAAHPGKCAQMFITMTNIYWALAVCQVLSQHFTWANSFIVYNNTMRSVLFYPYFTDRKTEAQK